MKVPRPRKQLESPSTHQTGNVSGANSPRVRRFLPCSGIGLCFVIFLACSPSIRAQSPPFDLKIEQVTSGTKHHFFGYIGQCQTIPWNASERYILGMEIDRIDRMPAPEDAATILLIDTHDDNKMVRVDETPKRPMLNSRRRHWPDLARHPYRRASRMG